ncbi:MAG: hypothetical protein CVT92_04630 [Bacteroidetes bacterium HGW-Bacteroidetes-1]|nr:MAG: hypothetical protein CVT92_04630 [Bacteroidetes bacterium HGW-Bacteroidetes-1]
MKDLLIYVPKITNRLQYAFDLVMGQQLGLKFRFSTNKLDFESFEGLKIIYGSEPIGNALFFKAGELLFEREISSQELKPFDFESIKAYFPVYHNKSAAPFDIFAAIFYLVSRYEEYLPSVRDMHGRFEANSSCLFEHGLLQKPVVNIWCNWLGRLLEQSFPGLKIIQNSYSYTPTYDIDAAWAYLHKGLYRSAGAYLRDIINLDFQEIKNRNHVLSGTIKDPFDTFKFQFELQKQHHLRPIYFILFADYGINDKNISVRNPAFQRLIKQLGDYAEIGIHPSYASFNNKNKLRKEVEALTEVLNREITKSRQHFLRLNLPTTYNHLIDLDITDDYTMGYASQPGFRAGITNSFLFYDLDHDVPTRLRVHPITLMDGTLRDYLKVNSEQALAVAINLIQEVKAVEGTFISLWHNETLSDQKRWVGWVDIYRKIAMEALP